MENTETPLSKAEYNYIRTIEKGDELIAKQEESLKKEKHEKKQLTKELEELRSTNEISAKELTELKLAYELVAKELAELKSNHEPLKSDLEETTKECQLHIDDIEAQNDKLLEQIEELKTQILPEEEMLFYQSCKADIILAELYQQKTKFTLKELEKKKFPVVLLKTEGAEPSGIETSNFKLVKNIGENEYQLSKK